MKKFFQKCIGILVTVILFPLLFLSGGWNWVLSDFSAEENIGG